MLGEDPVGPVELPATLRAGKVGWTQAWLLGSGQLPVAPQKWLALPIPLEQLDL